MKLPSKLIVTALLGGVLSANAADPAFWSWSSTPPMGWNSWDAFGSSVTEPSVLANAEYMDKNLKSHGWNLITIDIQWYEPTAQKDQYRRGAILEMDANGRLLPAPNRFPMTQETHSFKPIGDYLHAKGLKFGLHLMRGIPRQAVDRDNVPILGTSYTATNIVDKAHSCFWNRDMYGVDMSKPGAQEYYNSVFNLMASWRLDFVKVDDLAGHPAEIEGIRHALDQCGRPILLSVSMGSRPNQGAHLETNANMWRVSFDFWDRWPALYEQFANLNGHQPFQGAGHWPDADMLPFGHLKTWQTNTYTKFTHDEQSTVMTLWSIARSPLIIGANMPDNDAFTLSLLTDDEVIAVNQASSNNHQLFNTSNHVAWVADVAGSADKYLALFNTSPAPPPGSGRRRGGFGPGGPGGPGGPPPEMPTPGESATNATATNAIPAIDPAATLPAKISVALADIGLSGSCKVRDLWVQKDLGEVTDTVSATVNSHGAVLLRIHPEN
jgi:alpha-galactosidase